jgi:hypothetical protein
MQVLRQRLIKMAHPLRKRDLIKALSKASYGRPWGETGHNCQRVVVGPHSDPIGSDNRLGHS